MRGGRGCGGVTETKEKKKMKGKWTWKGKSRENKRMQDPLSRKRVTREIKDASSTQVVGERNRKEFPFWCERCISTCLSFDIRRQCNDSSIMSMIREGKFFQVTSSSSLFWDFHQNSLHPHRFTLYLFSCPLSFLSSRSEQLWLR